MTNNFNRPTYSGYQDSVTTRWNSNFSDQVSLLDSEHLVGINGVNQHQSLGGAGDAFNYSGSANPGHHFTPNLNGTLAGGSSDFHFGTTLEAPPLFDVDGVSQHHDLDAVEAFNGVSSGASGRQLEPSYDSMITGHRLAFRRGATIDDFAPAFPETPLSTARTTFPEGISSSSTSATPASEDLILPRTTTTTLSRRLVDSSTSNACPICGTTTSRERDMKRHMRKHDEKAAHAYKCPMTTCINKPGFPRKDKLNNHLQAAHGVMLVDGMEKGKGKGRGSDA